ncbi:uncharacterized protein [Rutidosis leptorrhynchoides]|uniref:uncharacterized protein n=1 Tax=Rutidosis leptorrhynchoides TaxID=125765 RepID=UPI003A990622
MPVRIRAGSWNVDTLTGKRYELVETLHKRKVDILCVQETRWKGRGAVKIMDYKLWFSGSRVARNGVGIFIGPPYNENVVDVSRRCDRIMSVRLVIQEVTYTIISAYAPHAGLGAAEKTLLGIVRRGCEDVPFGPSITYWGGSKWSYRNECRGVPGCPWGLWKTNAQLATFHSGGNSTQIDYLLLRKGDLRTCGDCKALTDLTCSSQHRLLVMDLVLRRRVTKSVRPVQPKILWKKLNGEKAETFKTLVVERLEAEVEMVSQDEADQMWTFLASTIREAAKEALGVAVGTSRGHRSDRESWWLSDEVQS